MTDLIANGESGASVRSKLNILGANTVSLASMGAIAPGVDISEALENLLNNAANRIAIIPPGDWTLSQDVTITGTSNLSIWMLGRIIHTAASLTFDGCDGLKLDGHVIGNSIPTAVVVSVDVGSNSVMLDDASLFEVTDGVISTDLSDDGTFPVFGYRGVINTKVGNVITLTDDTTLGGSFANIVPGSLFRMLTSTNPTKSGRVSVINCTNALITGYYERELIVTNVTHSRINVATRYGSLAAAFCYNISADVVARDARFYGAGFFKCRKLAIGTLNVDRAGFGGAVFKNCYDSGYAVLNVRQGLVYGVQIRDDTGTQPSTVNPDLQSTLNDIRAFTCGVTNLLECGRGFFPDNTAQDIVCGPMVITRTAGTGASLHIANAGIERLHMSSAHIVDHGQHLARMSTHRSTAPIRVEVGIGLDIDATVTRALHPTYVFTCNAAAGLVGQSRFKLDVEECPGTIDVSGFAKDLDFDVYVRNPPVDGSIHAVSITGPVDNIRTSRLKTTSTNGNKFARGASVTLSSPGNYPGRVYLNGVDVEPLSVSFADVYVECGDAAGEGGEVYVPSPTLKGGGTHAVSARYTAKVVVTDADKVGSFHKFNFASTVSRFETRPSYKFQAFDPGSILPAEAISTDVTVVGINLAAAIDVAWTGSDSQGVIITASRKNSTTIAVSFFNPTATPIDITAGTINLTWADIA